MIEVKYRCTNCNHEFEREHALYCPECESDELEAQYPGDEEEGEENEIQDIG